MNDLQRDYARLMQQSVGSDTYHNDSSRLVMHHILHCWCNILTYSLGHMCLTALAAYVTFTIIIPSSSNLKLGYTKCDMQKA